MTTTHPTQTTAFGRALSAWMERERLTPQHAARWLAVKRSEVEAWCAGTSQPAPAEITRVLTRIAR